MPRTRVNGHDLYYEEHGSGDALALLHGDYECTRYWAAQAAYFAPRYRVVRYDRHGYGRSSPRAELPPDFYDQDAADLMALLDHLEIDAARLVGHSGGGTAALLAAAGYPNRVRSVVTSGSHVYVEDITLTYIRDFIQALAEPDGPVRRAGEACHGARWREVAAMFTGRWLDPAWRGWTIVPALAAIRCPTLLLQGTRDGTATLEQFASMAGAIRGSRTVLVEGGGHVIHRRLAGLFNRQVQEFLSSIKPDNDVCD